MSSAKEAVPALILGYWRTIVAPPMVFARNMAEVKKEMEAKGFVKPMVASLAGDVEAYASTRCRPGSGRHFLNRSGKHPAALLDPIERRSERKAGGRGQRIDDKVFQPRMTAGDQELQQFEHTDRHHGNDHGEPAVLRIGKGEGEADEQKGEAVVGVLA